MVLFGGVAGLVAFAVWIFCIIDVITTPEDRARNLPKIVWLLLVILLVDIGSIAWLIAGHTWDGQGAAVRAERQQQRGAAGGPWASRRSSAPRAGQRPMSPDDDEEFLAGLRARAEEQRRRAREAEPPGDEDTAH